MTSPAETPDEPQTEEPRASRSRRRPLWLYFGLVFLLFFVLYLLPKILIWRGDTLGDRANETYRDGRDGIDLVRRARTYLGIAGRFPGWRGRADKHVSDLVFHVGNGMAVYENYRLPAAETVTKAVDYLAAHLHEADYHDRESAEDYLYSAGYHEVLTDAAERGSIPEQTDYTVRAYLMQGEIEPAATFAPAIRLGQVFEQDGWKEAARLRCLAGDFAPAGAYLDELLAESAQSTDRRAEVSAYYRELGRVLFATECALRAGDRERAARGGERLGAYGPPGALMQRYVAARLHDAAGDRAAAITALGSVALEPQTITNIERIPMLYLLSLLAADGRFDALLELARDQSLRWWRVAPPDEFTIMYMFEIRFFDDPNLWLGVADALAAVPEEHPGREALQVLRDEAYLGAAVGYAARRDERYRGALARLRDRQVATAWSAFVEALWGDREWSPEQLDLWRSEREEGWRWLVMARGEHIPVLERLMRELPPAQAQYVLQHVLMENSISIASIFFAGIARIKYGTRLGLPRLERWRENLSRWQEILASQPNSVLLYDQKI